MSDRSTADAAALLRLAQPPARRFLPGLLAGIATATGAVGLLATSAWLITRAAEQPPILYLSMAVVGVRAFALGRSAFRYLERLWSHDAAFRQLAAIRSGVVERLVPLAPAGLRDVGRGDLLTRLVRDVDDLQDVPLRVVQPLATAGTVAALSVLALWLVLPAAGWALGLCLLLAAVVGSAASSALAARAERELAPLRGALADDVLEVVENLDVLRAFGALEARLEAVALADDRLRRATLRRSLGAGAQAAVASLFAGGATLGTLLAGASDGSALGGPALAVIVLVPIAVFEVFSAVPAAVGALRNVRASARRVATAVPAIVPAGIPQDEPAAGAAPARAVADERPEGGPLVELTDVAVRWPDTPEPVVSGVSLRLAPGDRIHLDGPSGAGKTSLALALVRLLDYAGSYRVAGVEARELPSADVRTLVGLCEQRPWLFDDTIRQNLLFARDTASDAELLAVLDRVGLGDWAESRGGLDARVGERGGLVSGGQAQRIALARALLADFPVLVVDEPTANVDAGEGERLVRDILAAAAGDDRAVLLISHTPVPDDLLTGRVTLSGHPSGAVA